ncbi:MAG: 3-deoxy-7-phosphoheptulonate synthase [Bdellovibrionales bacterium]|nr:3-deoxy-7-phosphoheptulonate synthase [Bdellovibrionales bacterium]
MKSISIKNHKIEESTFTLMAGPCSIESKEQFESIVKFLKTQGVSIIRGGIFKPRTNPKDFQGLREKAFPIVKEIKEKEDFLFITEITDVRQIESLMEVADIFQVGTRNMYNYDLLKELAHINRPVLLKRNFSASIKEWLFAAKYLSPNNQIILCERGIRTFETAYRNTFDINAVSYLKQNSHLPIFVDPSHATGHNSLVSDIAKSALVAGAHGLLIEVHNEPDKALSDGAQALSFNQFSSLIKDLKNLSKSLNKKVL